MKVLIKDFQIKLWWYQQWYTFR